MRLAVVNFSSIDNVDANVASMEIYIHHAIDNKVDFIVFPELCLTGYKYYMDNTVSLTKAKLDEVIEFFLALSNNLIYIFVLVPLILLEMKYSIQPSYFALIKP